MTYAITRFLAGRNRASAITHGLIGTLISVTIILGAAPTGASIVISLTTLTLSPEFVAQAA